MKLRAGMAAALLALVLALIAADAAAQFVVGPPPPPGGVRFVVKGGLGYLYGPYGYGPYGFAYPQFSSTTIVVPPRINITNNYYGSQPPILGAGYDQDTRGVNLDLVPYKKPRPADVQETEPEVAKPLPGVEVSTPKAPVRPGEPVQQAKAPAPEWRLPPQPLPNPRDEGEALLKLGSADFQTGNYGTAAQRFGRAAELNPQLVQALFLLAQAELAMGKYHDALATIQKGMKLDKQWPRTPFQTRLELYAGRDADFAEHLKRLTDAAAANPNSAALLFLTAHQLWFDGQRKDALALFQRARPLAKDSLHIDAFLAAGGAGAMAAL